MSVAPRSDFPALDMVLGGEKLVYLDSAATSQKPRQVMDAVVNHEFYAAGGVNRGSHKLAGRATTAYAQARATVAKLVGADASEIIWTRNATEALNFVAYAIDHVSRGRAQSVLKGGRKARERLASVQARFSVGPGDNIVITRAEHHANLTVWQELCKRLGAQLRWFELNPDGTIDLESNPIDENTKVVAFTHVSNVTGAISPVTQLVALAREVGALTVLDACQSVPHLPVNFHELDVDFAAFSGHKMLGPGGIGALYGRAELLAALPPVQFGGSIVEIVTMEDTSYAAPPARFEAGTQAVAAAVGMGAAAQYLMDIGMERIAAHERELTELALAGLAKIPGIRILGPMDNRLGVIAFEVRGVHPHDVGQFLDEKAIAIRVGHHCAQPIHAHFGVHASSRVSFGPYTTAAEVGVFLEELAKVREFFGQVDE